MNVRYGPPGHKGVRTLMAVGADELDQGGDLGHAVRMGGYIALGAWVLGVVLKERRLQQIAFGAGLGLFGARVASGTLGKRHVEVVEDAPAAPADWSFVHSYKSDAW